MTTSAETKPEIKPFRIDIPQGDLDDLRDRLSRTRWPNEFDRGGHFADTTDPDLVVGDLREFFASLR